jgi:hypothetical protein
VQQVLHFNEACTRQTTKRKREKILRYSLSESCR